MKKIDSALVAGARAVIEEALALAQRPAVMCSFGKDSLAVLHLVREYAPRIPVIFHREPFMPWKYAFANAVIQDWGLTVYDWPPGEVALQQNLETGVMEVQNAYHIGGNRSCLLPTGLVPPVPGEPYLCTLHDLLEKPTGHMQYKWDLVMHGQKSSDVDPLLGKVPLLTSLQIHADCASAAFPLREWTDADVWAYTLEHGLPIHRERYNEAAGWREHADTTFNPDYFPACTACLQRTGPAQVACPKRGGQLIPNLAAKVPWVPELFRPAYIAPPSA